eukprot:scaffold16232_cov126-Isochrysis_galbana.AAC.7
MPLRRRRCGFHTALGQADPHLGRDVPRALLHVPARALRHDCALRSSRDDHRLRTHRVRDGSRSADQCLGCIRPAGRRIRLPGIPDAGVAAQRPRNRLHLLIVQLEQVDPVPARLDDQLRGSVRRPQVDVVGHQGPGRPGHAHRLLDRSARAGVALRQRAKDQRVRVRRGGEQRRVVGRQSVPCGRSHKRVRRAAVRIELRRDEARLEPRHHLHAARVHPEKVQPAERVLAQPVVTDCCRKFRFGTSRGQVGGHVERRTPEETAAGQSVPQALANREDPPIATRQS